MGNANNELNITIGKNIRKARENSQFTLEYVAELIGKTAHFLGEAERGRTGVSIATLIKLCEVLNVSTDYLILGKSESSLFENRILKFSEPQRAKVIAALNNILDVIECQQETEV